MTLEEVNSLTERIKKIKDDIEEKYGKRIKEINQKMKDLQNLEGKSKQYIEDQYKKLELQLQEIVDAQTKKLKEITEQTTKSISDKITLTTATAAQNIACRFGVPVEVLDKAVDVIKESIKKKIK